MLRTQHLAAPVTVYVEQFSAHPLERDAAELYGPPDGYIDDAGTFHAERISPADTPVYAITLSPEDGFYPLPYMARQADGSAWEEECAEPFAAAERARQGFYPDGSRSFEEIDRLGIGTQGRGNLINGRADIDFYRVEPPAGYTNGLPAAERRDVGEGDIPPERRGHDFFPYKPVHLAAQPPRPSLARIVNRVQRILASGDYLGAIWTQGSPRIEEAIYWFNLLLDVTVPICGNAAQRPHGEISNDGPKNLVDSVDYITSRIWADDAGRNRAGTVLIQEQQIFAARDVQKGDARPGGYVVTGGHGGIIGAVGHDGPATLTYLPTRRHTWHSEVRVTQLPLRTLGTARRDGLLVPVEVPIKSADDQLVESAIPKVTIVKDGHYADDDYEGNPEAEVDLIAAIEQRLTTTPLAGFIIEGSSPYGKMTSQARHRIMLRAVHCGMPVACVGRGNNDGFTPPADRWIGGRNLTATKARLLLMACLMKFGSLPVAADPDHPTAAEIAAVNDRLKAFQAVFDTH